MNNHTYHQQYMEAMKKLAGTGKHTCQHPGCNTVTLATYCQKHKQVLRPTVTDEKNV